MRPMNQVVVEKRSEGGGWRVRGGKDYDAWSIDAVWAVVMALRLAAETKQPEPRFSMDIPRHAIEEGRAALRILDQQYRPRPG
jgi:hypothetical protein